MAVSQVTKLTLNVLATLQDTLDLSTVIDQLNRGFVVDIANGTGTGQANNVFHDTRTVTTGATDSLDLAGSLQNAIRQTLTFTAIKAVIVYSRLTNTTVLSVTRPAANGVPIFAAAGDASPIGPGGLFVWSAPGAGVTVTAGTGDLLDIVNAAGASATYDIVIVGIA